MAGCRDHSPQIYLLFHIFFIALTICRWLFHLFCHTSGFVSDSPRNKCYYSLSFTGCSHSDDHKKRMKNETKDILWHIIHIQNRKKPISDQSSHSPPYYQGISFTHRILQSIEGRTKRNKTIYFNVLFVIFTKI